MARRKKPKKRFTFVVNHPIVTALMTLFTLPTLYYFYTPKVAVQIGDPVVESDPFSSQITVTNQSNLPIKKVLPSISPGEWTFQGRRVPPPSNQPYSSSLEFEAIPPRDLGPGVPFTFSLSEGMLMQGLGVSKLSLDLDYDVWFLPIHREARTLLRLEAREDGKLRWFQEPTVDTWHLHRRAGEYVR